MIRNRYNQVPHLTQYTKGKVTNSLLYTTNESQEVSPFPPGAHKAQLNRRPQTHNKHKTEKNIKDPQKSTASERSVKYFTGGFKQVLRRQPKPLIQMWIKTHRYLVYIQDPNLSMHHLPEHINQDIKRR